MRAIRIHQWASAPVVEHLAPPARAAGETLVRIDAAAVSHLDLTVASGQFELRPPLPYVGGVEGSATVLESGEAEPGAQVLLRGAGLGLRRDGTWREVASVPSRAITVLPQRLEPTVAAAFFVPATTAYVALHDVARVEPGERVAVAGGAGAVGSLIVQLALRAGAEVTGIVGRAEQLGQIPAGAAGVLLSDAAAPGVFAAERGFDLLLDTPGGAGLAGRVKWVRPGGRAVCIGYVAGAETTLRLPSWLLDDVSLLPVNMIRRESRAREICGDLVAQIAAGELSVATEALKPDEVPGALVRLAEGRIHGRAVVVF
jgi:NADPH2:quinone reductase